MNNRCPHCGQEIKYVSLYDSLIAVNPGLFPVLTGEVVEGPIQFRRVYGVNQGGQIVLGYWPKQLVWRVVFVHVPHFKTCPALRGEKGENDERR